MTPPDFGSVEALLAQALHTGEIIEVRYLGGKTPGMVRQLIPLAINNETLRARCVASGLPKLFEISKLRLPTDPAPALPPAAPSFADIKQLMAAHGDRWAERGWHVACSVSAIALHKRFKNGNPKATPTLDLRYVAELVEEHYDIDLNVVRNTRPHPRPWHLHSQRTRLFSSFEKAAQAFLDEERVAG